jgi:hypothetical protein
MDALSARVALRFPSSKTVRKLHQVYVVCSEYRDDLGVLVKFTLLTFTRGMLPIAMNVLVAMAFAIPASPVELAAVVPLIVIGTRLPISLDGLGVQEGLYVVLFAMVGVAGSDALLMSLTARALGILGTLPFALAHFLQREGHAPLGSMPRP